MSADAADSADNEYKSEGERTSGDCQTITVQDDNVQVTDQTLRQVEEHSGISLCSTTEHEGRLIDNASLVEYDNSRRTEPG